MVSPRPPQPSWDGPEAHVEASKPGWRHAVPGTTPLERYDQTSPDEVSAIEPVVDAASRPGVDALPEVSIAVTS